MVDGSALGDADDLIAAETNRFEAKGAITVRFPPGVGGREPGRPAAVPRSNSGTENCL